MKFDKYKDHPLIPLYGENPIPNYNSEFELQEIEYSNNGMGNPTDNNPTIAPYLVNNPKGCVVVYPGGALVLRSDCDEGMRIAEAYNKFGYSAFVVRYRVGNRYDVTDGYDGETIIIDAQRAVQYVRYNATEFGIDPEKIAVCGFSAGGFLATVISQKQISPHVIEDEIGKVSNIPNAAILCYAGISLQPNTISQILPNILTVKYKDSEKAEVCNFWDANLNVTPNVPPTFSWCSKSDTVTVPRYHSNLYCKELKKAGVFCEEHIYENTPHGKGLSSAYDAADWLERSVKFLKKLGF